MPVTLNSVLQVVVFLVILLLLTKPMGLYLTNVFAGEKNWLTPVLGPVERVFYKLCGINPDEEHKWTGYVIAMLVFSVVGMLLLYLIQRTQAWLPLNPQGLPNVEPNLAFNTAASFTTNTNWQFYSGETTMSYLTQMAGLAFHNFASAAVGIVLAVALIRGLARRSAQTLGNFWVDLTRCVLYVLLPISIVGALVHGRANNSVVRKSLESCGRLVSTTEGFKPLCTSLRLAGDGTKLQCVHDRPYPGGNDAGHRAGTGRFAGVYDL